MTSHPTRLTFRSLEFLVLHVLEVDDLEAAEQLACLLILLLLSVTRLGPVQDLIQVHLKNNKAFCYNYVKFLHL